MKLWIATALLLMFNTRGFEGNSDSLKSALEAISQRQRDLGDGDDDRDFILRAYRYLSPKQYVQTSIGQPEDIGYGFQKSGVNNGGMFYSPPQITEAIEPERNIENLDRVILGYLENDETDQTKDSTFRELDKKSVFREQQEIEDKDARHVGDETTRKMKHYGAERSLDTSDDGEYLSFLQSVWRKYKQEYPVSEDNDMSEEDMAHLFKYLRQHDELRNEDMDGKRVKAPTHFEQENHRSGVNEFLNGVAGWNDRNHHRKRQNDKHAYDEVGVGNSIYSWNGPPALIGAFGGDDPNYEDNNMIPNYPGIYPERWFPTESEYVQKEELYPQYEKPRKRIGNSHELPLSSYAFMQPGYGAPANRKRFPVTKRSLRLYASPPLLHHQKRTGSDEYDAFKKSSSHSNMTTDPRVVKELNQLFSGDENFKDIQTITKIHEVHFGNDESDVRRVGGDQKDFTVTPVNIATHEKSQHSTKSQNDNNTEDESSASQQDDEPIEIKKKSIDWSDYFGIDRRSEKVHPSHGQHLQDSADNSDGSDKWAQENFERLVMKLSPDERSNTNLFKLYGYVLKRSQMFAQPFDTRNFERAAFSKIPQRNMLSKKNDKNDEDNNTEPLKFDKMDKKLQHIEDMILNQAVKYTGAHEDTTDLRKIQNVKNTIVSQLAAAYSLEKIRKTLADFKAILGVHGNSEHHADSELGHEIIQKMKKRMVVKKNKAVVRMTDNGEKVSSNGDEASRESSTVQFLDDPIALAQLSEGYMGGTFIDDPRDCLDVTNLLDKCHVLDESSDNQKQEYHPLCCLRQLCYTCNPLLGEGMFRCNALLVEMCGGEAGCLEASQHCGNLKEDSGQCACVIRYFFTK